MSFTLKTTDKDEKLIESLMKQTGNKTKKGALIDAAFYMVNYMPFIRKKLRTLQPRFKERIRPKKAIQLEINFPNS